LPAIRPGTHCELHGVRSGFLQIANVTQLAYRQAIAAHLLALEQVRAAVGTRSLQWTYGQ